ncbi:MAG: ACR3 family arsenite efflux transporter [Candidatus Nanopelagicales bacterium]|nr:ACR3 family arsenite efflux transporter [Candidatus Nanopelagicales bacterium]MCF8538988.1 ACR3 family arsenite efflux transporter [Candidatus Nanopelagicales bacterium]MCF8551753.1 ACR3 family arsenite efflux transporter [Candidatus Nanopelagicales bacterium]
MGKLSVLDRFLPVWIVAAMAGGLLLGRFFPSIQDILDAVKIDQTSLPIALGLFLMMYPVLAKVRYEDMGHVTGDRKLLLLSLLLNWIIGPLLMFALAWIFLADYPAFRTGLIVIGLARCIAMVLIWNDLACGDREAGALLVAINSVFQILAYAVLGTFYLTILPGWLGLDTQDVTFSTWDITKAVLVFLGIPLALGMFTRYIGVKTKGRQWYETKFIPRISPWALYGLLFTIVILFALQGEAITSDPASVALIAVPLLIYFIVMWGISFLIGYRSHMSYPKTATLAFTAAGNNFELAIAVSIGVWGVTSGQALTGVIGPLIEVPALVALVYVSLWLRRKYYSQREKMALP